MTSCETHATNALPVWAVAEPAEGSYFVAVYPPCSLWSSQQVEATRRSIACGAAPVSGEPFGLYVHIPFCAQRCQYCYYLSYANRPALEIDEYVGALIHEVEMYAAMPRFAGRKLGFVYFGGGTPSLLGPAPLRRLLDGLRRTFPWTAAEEISFECAPRSSHAENLQILHDAGVNRISMGIQQLDDDVLGRNGRVHLVADVAHAWEAIRAFDWDEVNVDLMVGLVGETEPSFHTSLERVIGMGPESVTIYQLEIPLNTPLYRALRGDSLRGALPRWETKRLRLAAAFDRLEAAGYRPRSAYAAARGPRHPRFVYQEDQYRGADLVGIGVSSLSYVAGAHYQNIASLAGYLDSVRNGSLPIGRAYRLSDAERLTREFVLQLKLGRVETQPFRDKFAVDLTQWFADPLQRCAARGWLTYDSRQVTLTRDGLLRVDRMIPAFYAPEHQGVRYS
jgi:oxygen-independent coproporphyrinogen-3 oxidase